MLIALTFEDGRKTVIDFSRVLHMSEKNESIDRGGKTKIVLRGTSSDTVLYVLEDIAEILTILDGQVPAIGRRLNLMTLVGHQVLVADQSYLVQSMDRVEEGNDTSIGTFRLLKGEFDEDIYPKM